jgi:hypothetical protein
MLVKLSYKEVSFSDQHLWRVVRRTNNNNTEQVIETKLGTVLRDAAGGYVETVQIQLTTRCESIKASGTEYGGKLIVHVFKKAKIFATTIICIKAIGKLEITFPSPANSKIIFA